MNPARGSSFFLLRKKELSSGVVVYLALSLRMSLHVQVTGHAMHESLYHTSHSHVHGSPEALRHASLSACCELIGETQWQGGTSTRTSAAGHLLDPSEWSLHGCRGERRGGGGGEKGRREGENQTCVRKEEWEGEGRK